MHKVKQNYCPEKDCLKPLSKKDVSYAKFKFGYVTCIEHSPMDKYSKKGEKVDSR